MYEQDGTNRHSMSQVKAVKQYSRSSADQESPLAHELRPVSVLQMTMVYLMYNIMDLVEDESDVSMQIQLCRANKYVSAFKNAHMKIAGKKSE